ncbi:MAG: UDP-N-acetylmuramoyl-L-alanyl-D-glutamate--2,6-diaminopimelate ligase [Candidatus Marinimicrobia bacterium]|jgi:UDP-N-acetylmuramoyl-L-alanyl-D-glutamate--2,6-diaminopimelate ligase|nr:UDP-N-acetylmuramoyl-L-alanyl-D-glutamate--2,6-diaminopimelate ligase [Candidatus Neomarinimicrobiota bacterium]MDD5709419.1 UDP-N-acetylmuramoyl-L-alanyl-D-glutamate--2,6-diaminopimelate ligase [Candidatus Neomarinimicrobiota bacterium]MDX9777297.1 UDP-N-acetylmuramoyl-L-alanyl-D-glutamate--2,6-diaminopimelate ligase [bacterium]
MKQLRSLLRQLSASLRYEGPDMMISDIAYDSRKVSPGSLFVAIRGAEKDGHDFIDDAAARGALACIAEEASNSECPQILVPDSRIALAELSRAFYLSESFPEFLVGVTGTNGKTTITHLLYQFAEAAAIKAALIGTLGLKTPDYRLDAERTTPESRDLAERFRDFGSEGIRAVFMEVSSHAIALKRVHGLYFNLAIFSNLTRDHLDFHRDMEDYFETKSQLFRNAASAVVNCADLYGNRLVQTLKGKVLRYAVSMRDADVYFKDLRVSIDGIQGILTSPLGDIAVDTPLLGTFNAENIAAAVAAAVLLFPEKAGLLQNFSFRPVPGRMERILTRRGTAVIDYAHTPDAMEKALQAVRDLEGVKRVITVFGCGGDRDHGKRPLMGAVAERYSEHIILCNDNPRSEDPLAIIEAIRSGIHDMGRTEICVDRAVAIARAYSLSQPGDILMVLGKGEENYMEIKGERIPFQDKKIIFGLE